nr:bifunctional NADH-specific enoyl-ACP reductase/trans-2-enoyl-CoA reductase [Burkholderiaceae bacterium]
IPAMPLYLAVLFKVMKQHGTHEGCIEQIHRLFTECLYNASPRQDDAHRFRVDDKELRHEIQAEVEALWPTISNENLNEVSDFRGFRADFLKLFGFGVSGVDYDADVEVDVAMNHLKDLSRP